MSSMEADMSSVVEVDMFDMSADFAPTAANPAVGSRATDRASIKIRMVRPSCIAPKLYPSYAVMLSKRCRPHRPRQWSPATRGRSRLAS